jgi:hypothetical protein
MGGPLSGVLSNIYLGYVERNIINTSGIITYQRYMDDILLISNFNVDELANFMTLLKDEFALNITSSSNYHNVTFLDMCISIKRLQNTVSICPFSKNNPIYPIPSTITTRNVRTDRNIIQSQILRTWRTSTDDEKFSKSVNYYLSFLQGNQHLKKLRKRVFRFLLPCKISTHYWSTSILLCAACNNITNHTHTEVNKIININGKYIATKEPLNCHSQSIYMLINYENNFQLILVESIHIYFKHNKVMNSNIVPLGKFTKSKINNFINKYKQIHHTVENNDMKTYPCRVYPIFKNSNQIYGVRTVEKKRKPFASFFNEYKKIAKKKRQ